MLSKFEMASATFEARLASIGPETSKTIHALGLAPDVEAKEHNINGLVRALRQRVEKGK